MLDLDDARWRTLRHAYGMAEDIPERLRQLEEFPAEGDAREPWHALWSALAHQGDVYPRVLRGGAPRGACARHRSGPRELVVLPVSPRGSRSAGRTATSTYP